MTTIAPNPSGCCCGCECEVDGVLASVTGYADHSGHFIDPDVPDVGLDCSFHYSLSNLNREYPLINNGTGCWAAQGGGDVAPWVQFFGTESTRSGIKIFEGQKLQYYDGFLERDRQEEWWVKTAALSNIECKNGSDASPPCPDCSHRWLWGEMYFEVEVWQRDWQSDVPGSGNWFLDEVLNSRSPCNADDLSPGWLTFFPLISNDCKTGPCESGLVIGNNGCSANPPQTYCANEDPPFETWDLVKDSVTAIFPAGEDTC